MSRKTDSEYGILYEDHPTLGKTLTLPGALLPWAITTLLIAPALVVAGLPWYPVFMTMPWVGLLLSVIYIEMHFSDTWI